MSDPKRATLITVGAPKSANTNVNKTVRLTVNLDESNESKYPELNYKELLITTARKKRVENGKKTGLDPFSDNDDDVERVARKFEQKYGGNSTYGRKGRSKYEEFADIGAGYDENDSFIDNTHGYDEMIPPECDTLYGGFYINCGSLEFKTVSENQTASDGEPNRRNKRQISSSSSEEDSSESSSESDSQEAKDPKAIANGEVDSHKTEHRKKKNKTIDEQKAKKIRRTDSSAVTSGKQTSDDNVHGDAESADSRTSQSDSLTSKPAPSSENAVTSDSSRDVEAKAELKLPSPVRELLEELETLVRRARDDPSRDSAKADHCVVRLHQSLDRSGADGAMRRVAWHHAALLMNTSRAKLLQMVKLWKTERAADCDATDASAPTETAQTPAPVSSTNTPTSTSHKRKADDAVEGLDVSRLTPDEKEAKIVETIQMLAELIAERRPGMIAAYNAECERVQEKRKKLQLQSATEGAPFVDKRLPKRRFPWCPRARTLLTRLAALAGDPESAANLLATRVLKLFPAGFVRMPTLLRQADLSKEIKASDIKRPRLGSQSASQSVITSTQQLNEQIQFPSSLTVTTTSVKNIDEDKDKYKVNPAAVFGTVINSYSLSQDLVIEKDDKKKDSEQCKDDLYNPPSNIGSITITAVPPSQKDKKTSNVNDKPKDTPLIRVKSPAALNEMVANKKEKEKDKYKKTDKDKEHNSKRFANPLHVESTKHNLKKFDTPLHVDSHNLKKFDTPMLVDTTKNSKRIDTPMLVDTTKNSKRIDTPMLVDTTKNSKRIDTPMLVDTTKNSKRIDTPMLVDTTKNSKRIDTPMLVDTTKNSKRIDTPMLVDTTKNSKRIDTPMLVDTTKNSKRLDTPLHVDTTNHNKKEPEKSPNQKTKEEFSKKQIESMRVAESNIPRPGLVTVSHSPTFAKPDKRPPEVKKKKDILIVSDVDPLGDIIQEPVSVDDDSSDVELVEEKFVDKSEPKSENIVPLKDRSDKSDSHKSVKNNVQVKSGSEKSASGKDCSVRKKTDEPTKEDFDSVMRDLSEMKNSQEPTTLNCNSFGVITNAKHEPSKHTYTRPAVIGEPRTDKNKFAERTSLKKMDGYSEVTG